MFTLLRVVPFKRILNEQLPALVGAWLIAELLYKFHSFSLEAAAFLATWFVFDALIQLVKRGWQAARDNSSPPNTDLNAH